MRLPLQSLLWIGFFALILWAWAVTFTMARLAGLDLLGRPVAANMMPMTGFAHLAAMWAIMMAAMMLPTLVPALTAYDDVIRGGNGSRAGWLGVVLGYLAVWGAFSVLFAAVQVGLLRAGVVDTLGIAASPLWAGALLIGAGLFQFSRTKRECQGVCLSPMLYFLGRWRAGFGGGLRMGLGLGAFCVGCCWAFMVLGFVGGVMSLLWMGLATLFMVLEKLPDIGARVTRPLGVALVLGGIAVATGVLQKGSTG